MKLLASAVRLRSLYAKEALILLYHRIGDLPSDPWSLAVKKSHFEEHLIVLRQYFTPISLGELHRRSGSPRTPRMAVSLSFDDGYADNLFHGKPLLERYDCPATVFLTSGVLGKAEEFWWDELERLILHPRPLPATLELCTNGKWSRWQREEECFPGGDPYAYSREGTATRNVLLRRQDLYRSIWNLLRAVADEERQRLLREIAQWSGGESKARPSHRPLSIREVETLVSGGLVSAGAHTVSHPALGLLPIALQHDEIVGSKKRLEEMTGRPVTQFSYPFGGSGDYGCDTVGIVKEAGFESGCSNVPGVVRPTTDRYQLPRIYIKDWDGETFQKVLFSWFGGRLLR